MRLCVIIPCHNHGRQLGGVLLNLEQYALPCIVVDDGSSEESLAALKAACVGRAWVTVIYHPRNLGKGAAVRSAVLRAEELGFTHALQIDADGQHDLTDIPRFVEYSRHYPEDVISGLPVYDDSAPKGRRYGRQINNFWTAVETLSLKLKESMCGFRLYPVKSTAALFRRQRIASGMPFDAEILVRLYWQGLDVHYLPTKVIYPEDGYSNFRMLRDNLRISLTHAKLCCLLPFMLPRLLRRRRRAEHWAALSEVHGLAGMKLLLTIQGLLGRRVCQLLLFPIVSGYWLCSSKARRRSALYLRRLKAYLEKQGIKQSLIGGSWRHLLHFAAAMLDKICAWRGELKIGPDLKFAPGTRELIDKYAEQGCLVLTSHLGNIEACRALIEQHRHLELTAVVYEGNAQAFAAVMQRFAPKSRLNLLDVRDSGPMLAALLQEKLQEGKWAAIAADRLPLGGASERREHVYWLDFLGVKAPFGAGPFVLAALLKCPVLQLFGVKRAGVIEFSALELKPLSRAQHSREEVMRDLALQYAANLERLTLNYPFEWFNFYDFWALPEGVRDAKARAS